MVTRYESKDYKEASRHYAALAKKFEDRGGSAIASAHRNRKLELLAKELSTGDSIEDIIRRLPETEPFNGMTINMNNLNGQYIGSIHTWIKSNYNK